MDVERFPIARLPHRLIKEVLSLAKTDARICCLRVNRATRLLILTTGGPITKKLTTIENKLGTNLISFETSFLRELWRMGNYLQKVRFPHAVQKVSWYLLTDCEGFTFGPFIGLKKIDAFFLTLSDGKEEPVLPDLNVPSPRKVLISLTHAATKDVVANLGPYLRRHFSRSEIIFLCFDTMEYAEILSLIEVFKGISATCLGVAIKDEGQFAQLLDLIIIQRAIPFGDRVERDLILRNDYGETRTIPQCKFYIAITKKLGGRPICLDDTLRTIITKIIQEKFLETISLVADAVCFSLPLLASKKNMIFVIIDSRHLFITHVEIVSQPLAIAKQ